MAVWTSSHPETQCICGRGPQPQRISSSSGNTGPETSGRAPVPLVRGPVNTYHTGWGQCCSYIVECVCVCPAHSTCLGLCYKTSV